MTFWSVHHFSILLAGGTDSSNVLVAIVTTIGVVFAAGVTALAATRQRAGSPAPTGPNANEVLVQQYITGLEHDRDAKASELLLVQEKLGKLRDACWERGLDPDNLISGQAT